MVVRVVVGVLEQCAVVSAHSAVEAPIAQSGFENQLTLFAINITKPTKYLKLKSISLKHDRTIDGAPEGVAVGEAHALSTVFTLDVVMIEIGNRISLKQTLFGIQDA